MEIQTILVTGATGNQGSAVVRHLVQKGFKVIALTRNANTARAQQLVQPNVQVVTGDLSNASTYRKYLQQVNGVFSVQALEKNSGVEVKQGTDLASEAKAAGIKHFVYSSAAGANLQSGVPHFETKFAIENHIRQIGLPFTILRPTSFFENFLMPQVKKGIDKGKLMQPVKKQTVLQYVATDDIGKAAAQIFLDPAKYMGRSITLAGDEKSMEAIAETFSKVLQRNVKYSKLPRLITRLFLGKGLYKMFAWMDKGNYSPTALQACKEEFPYFLSLEDWIKQYYHS